MKSFSNPTFQECSKIFSKIQLSMFALMRRLLPKFAAFQRNWMPRQWEIMPTSLTSCLYKIIARVPRERLECVLPSTSQRTNQLLWQGIKFWTPLLLQTSSSRNGIKETERLDIKLGVEKAIAKVDWDFLDEILRVKGFETNG